jgi:Poxvirus Late Transcription Factor VLTF3 like
MSLVIETTHLKFVARFEVLLELGQYLREVASGWCSEQSRSTWSCATVDVVRETIAPGRLGVWAGSLRPAMGLVERVELVIDNVRALKRKYCNVVTPILSDYYSSNSIESQTHATSLYFEFLISQNILGETDCAMSRLEAVVETLESGPGFEEWCKASGDRGVCDVGGPVVEDSPFARQEVVLSIRGSGTFASVVGKYIGIYRNNCIALPPTPANSGRMCPFCREVLALFPDDSEMRCEKCGYVETLWGTLFDDSQIFNQQITCTKHKKHSPNAHCMKWLNQLQAKENKTIPQKAIDILNHEAVSKYTCNGVRRSMDDLKCWQIRAWLKEKGQGLSKLNNHAPLLRKIITGLNGRAISPPQLKPEEEQLVAADFARIVVIFERISKRPEVLRLLKKTSISNKLYYPFFLLKILTKHLRRDPRLRGLIECIHLQSAATLTKDDLLWREICRELKDYKYEPTDRTMLIDIF